MSDDDEYDYSTGEDRVGCEWTEHLLNVLHDRGAPSALLIPVAEAVLAKADRLDGLLDDWLKRAREKVAVPLTNSAHTTDVTCCLDCPFFSAERFHCGHPSDHFADLDGVVVQDETPKNCPLRAGPTLVRMKPEAP